MVSQIQSFGGVPTPSFLIVEKVSFSVLPASQVQTIESPYRSGTNFINKKYGVRVFDVEVTIIAKDKYSVMHTSESLAEWLHYDEPQPLIFRDNPYVTYYAIVDNSVDLEKFSKIGKGQITFLCPYPHGIGSEKIDSSQSSELTINNEGTVESYPIFTLDFKNPTTFITLVNDDKFVMLGEPIDVDLNAPIQKYEVILDDSMTTTSGWTPLANGSFIEGGIVAGSYSSDGERFIVNDYGEGSGWHGAAVKKTLSQSLQDFQVEFIINLTSKNDPSQVGRNLLQILDNNNQIITSLCMKDTFQGVEENQAEIRVGDISTGTRLINSGGYKKNDWDNFYGMLRISRIGNVWRTYVAQIDSQGYHYAARSETFTDKDKKYTNPVTQVQLHMGQNGTIPVCTMGQHKVKVFKVNNGVSTDIPYIANQGDIIEINHEDNSVLKNGEDFKQSLDWSSDFFALEKGKSTIQVYPSDAVEVTAKHRSRYL